LDAAGVKAATAKPLAIAGGFAEFDRISKGFQEAALKSGRVLSARNVATLRDVADDLEELRGAEGLTRAQRALLGRCADRIRQLIKESGNEDEADDADDDGKTGNIIDASALVLASGSSDDLRRLSDAIAARLAVDESDRRAANYRRMRRT